VARKPDFRHDDLNVFAHFQAEMGVAENSRRLISLLSSSGIELNVLPFEANTARKQHPLVHPTGAYNPRAKSLSCVNPDQLGSLVASYGIPYSTEIPHIGFWSWELEDFPKVYRSAANLLNEIWTVSDFANKSITSSVKTPVRTLRLPVPIPRRKTKLTRKDLKLPANAFLITTSFDFNSDVNRKNPVGAIEAFRKAFPKPGIGVLLLKSINGKNHTSELENLKNIAQNRSDIIFMDEYLNHYENHALLELSDVFLSLHRSEGYGINLADSMARKTAVIATGYSGNLDFMDEESGILVPYSMVEVSNYAGIDVKSQWAEPDLDFAGNAIRRLAEEPQNLRKLGQAGLSKIAAEHSLGATAKIFRKDFMYV